jgi:hypothetical protein
MSKEQSQEFLSKIGLEWVYMKPDAKKKLEEKFIDSKKNHKKSVKEFLIVSLYLKFFGLSAFIIFLNLSRTIQ